MNKPKLSIHTRISIRIFILFIIMIFGSWIADHLHTQLGDWHCHGRYFNPATKDYVGCNYGPGLEVHDPEWHWGMRHWLLLFMGCCLVINQVFTIANLSDESK